MSIKKFKPKDTEACRTAKTLIDKSCLHRKPEGAGSNTELGISEAKVSFDKLTQHCTIGVPNNATEQHNVVCMSVSNALDLADLGVLVFHEDGQVAFEQGHAQNSRSKTMYGEYRSYLKTAKKFNQEEVLLRVMCPEESNTYLIPNVLTNEAVIIKDIIDKEKFHILKLVTAYTDDLKRGSDGFKPGKIIERMPMYKGLNNSIASLLTGCSTGRMLLTNILSLHDDDEIARTVKTFLFVVSSMIIAGSVQDPNHADIKPLTDELTQYLNEAFQSIIAPKMYALHQQDTAEADDENVSRFLPCRKGLAGVNKATKDKLGFANKAGAKAYNDMWTSQGPGDDPSVTMPIIIKHPAVVAFAFLNGNSSFKDAIKASLEFEQEKLRAAQAGPPAPAVQPTGTKPNTPGDVAVQESPSFSEEDQDV